MPINKNTKSKWQDASNLINEYRWKMSDLLRSFDDDDRKSDNYKDLIKDIKENACKAIRDVSPKDAIDCNYKSENSDKINWKSKKIWIILLASPVAVELVKYIPLLFGRGTTP